jgi:hypothetical protein
VNNGLLKMKFKYFILREKKTFSEEKRGGNEPIFKAEATCPRERKPNTRAVDLQVGWGSVVPRS